MGLLQAGGSCAQAQRERPGSGAGRPAVQPACGSCRCQRLATSAHLHGAAHGGHAALRGGAGRVGGEGEPVAGLVALPGLLAGAPVAANSAAKGMCSGARACNSRWRQRRPRRCGRRRSAWWQRVLSDPQSRKRLGGCRLGRWERLKARQAACCARRAPRMRPGFRSKAGAFPRLVRAPDGS